MSTRLNIFGIAAMNGIPVCYVLEMGLDNSIHRNLIEIARDYWLADAPLYRYSAIMIAFDGESESHVYTF